MMRRIWFLQIVFVFSTIALAYQGPKCNEDITLINDLGCDSPCCFQDPPNSGHYVFLHNVVEKIDIRGNSANVQSLSFPNLVSVEKSIRITYNQPGSVVNISFPSLHKAASLDITGNSGLVHLDLPHLNAIESEEFSAIFKVQSNANLTVLNAPLLRRISSKEAGNAYLQIRYNALLANIDFPMLRTVEAMEDYSEAYVFIQHNDSAQQLNMNNLQELSAGIESISYLIIDDMANLEQISFSSLNELLPTGTEYNFSELTVSNCPKLSEFVFPQLRRVTLLQLASLKGTERAMFPNLSELDYLWVFRSCANSESSLKMYICGEQTIMDVYLNNDDGLCGPSGLMLYSENPLNRAECDASDICQSFIPDVNECKCGSPGLCTTGN